MYVHRFLLDKYTLCISKVDTNVEIVYQKKGKEMTDSVAENFSVFFFCLFPSLFHGMYESRSSV